MLLSRRVRELLLSSLPPKPSCFLYTQRSSYVDVKMKWKKDRFYDSLDTVNSAKELRPLMSLKNIIAAEPDACIPISAVSKRGRSLEIATRVAGFLRKYPAVFEEFVGSQYNLPWFKLTPEAADLDRRERAVYEARRPVIVGRLRRLVLMSKEKRLPLRVIQGMLWYLGLPEDFLQKPEENSDGCLRVVEMGDGEQGLSAALDPGEKVLSVLQRNAMKMMGEESPPPVIPFPLFPSKGLRLKHKIEQWLEEFQRLPYISPYEDSSGLDPNSDVSEKRAAGVLHELLCLFVESSAERRKLLCLKKHLGLSQKFHKVFERHPHLFYLQLKNKTCTVVLKEAYCAGLATAIERHPMLEVRKKHVKLMNKSEAILRTRRSKKPLAKIADENLDAAIDSEIAEENNSIFQR